MGLGMKRAGLPGVLAAWLGFTLPSALALIAFASGVSALGDVSGAGWLQGLKVAAVAVVAHAVWGMGRKLAPDRPRATIALLAAIVALLWTGSLGQVAVIAIGGLVGWRFLRGGAPADETRPHEAPAAGAPAPQALQERSSAGRRLGASLLALFLALLLGLPLLREATGTFGVAVVDSFYRAGALVFGGGHVVLPLLQAEVVPPGWVDDETFIAGYGAAQAVPGPLFTFSAYLGAAMRPGAAGIGTGLLALAAVFLPSFLLLVGVLPFWDRLRTRAPVQAALRGVNAAVVGLLLAALYDPVWTSAIHDTRAVALALAAFLLLSVWRWPAWLVVILSAVAGAVGLAAV